MSQSSSIFEFALEEDEQRRHDAGTHAVSRDLSEKAFGARNAGTESVGNLYTPNESISEEANIAVFNLKKVTQKGRLGAASGVQKRIKRRDYLSERPDDFFEMKQLSNESADDDEGLDLDS